MAEKLDFVGYARIYAEKLGFMQKSYILQELAKICAEKLDFDK